MDEWAVVGVIAVLFGLIAAIVTPLLKLNTSITQLTCAVSVLQKKHRMPDNEEQRKPRQALGAQQQAGQPARRP